MSHRKAAVDSVIVRPSVTAPKLSHRTTVRDMAVSLRPDMGGKQFQHIIMLHALTGTGIVLCLLYYSYSMAGMYGLHALTIQTHRDVHKFVRVIMGIAQPHCKSFQFLQENISNTKWCERTSHKCSNWLILNSVAHPSARHDANTSNIIYCFKFQVLCIQTTIQFMKEIQNCMKFRICMNGLVGRL